MKRAVALILTLLVAPMVAFGFSFDNIDGGQLDLSDWAGQPVLVVNTASRCGFTGQYEGLQGLQDRYGAQGLVVLAVPSNDFRQELASGAQVREFCELTYGLTLPMTEITRVTGAQAHPFYQWVRETTGFAPRWNFNKVLVGRDGAVVATFGATTRPDARTLITVIEAQLEE